MKRYGFLIFAAVCLFGFITGCEDPINDLVKAPEIGLYIDGQILSEGSEIDLGSIAADGTGGAQGLSVTVYIRNNGNDDLTITSAVLSTGDTENFYLAPSFSSPLIPGGETSISIGFDPSSRGELSAVVSIGSSDQVHNPFTFTVTGTGLSVGTVSPPTFSPPAGTYSTAQEILLSCSTEDSEIYYTLDGSVPSASSIKYSGAISLDETTTIKAIGLRAGWDDSPVAVAEYILAIEYDLEFEANGGTGTMSPQAIIIGETVNINPNTFTRSGFSFTGWSTSAGGQVEYEDEGFFTMSTHGAVLWAKWEIQSYLVVFESGEGSSVSSQIVDYNGTVTEPADPESLYSTFGGWYKEEECVNPWNFSTDVITGPRTLYAKWTLAYSVGSDGPSGGKIFYENPDYDPEDPDDWRFMEAAADSRIAFNLVSQSPAEDIDGADGTAIGTGLQNTQDIVDDEGTSYSYGARYCYELSFSEDGKVFDDWFLPSKDEVSEMISVCGTGGTPMNIQISSSEYDTSKVWSYMFMGGYLSQSNKTSSSDYMFFRPARRF